MAHPEPWAYVDSVINSKKSKNSKPLIADKILDDYIARLEKENQQLREQLKLRDRTDFKQKIVRKGNQ